MRSARLAALLGLTLASCTAPQFVCSDDLECVAGSVQGLCLDGGHCVFPDDSCPDGYRFPTFAAGDLAGQCATLPEDAIGSSSGADASTTTTGGASDASSSSSPSTTTTTTTSTTTSTSTSTSTSSSEASSGGPLCTVDPMEPNDVEDDATPFVVSNCQGTVAGTIGGSGADPRDVYVAPGLNDCAQAGVVVTVSGSGNVRGCLGGTCSDGTSPSAMTQGSSACVGVNGIQTCCSPMPLTIAYDCGPSSLAQTWVSADSMDDACVDYTVTVEPQ